MPTSNTIRLEQKRLSEDVQKFKQDVLFFFNKLKVHPKIQYKICIDLSKKIDMPFYAEAKIGERSNMSPVECAKEYVRLLIQFNDENFSEIFLTYLTRQQQQTFRKIHLRSSKQIERKKRYGKKCIWEHPVPSNYSKRLLLSFIQSKNFEEASAYIDFLSTVPQIVLSKSDDARVNKEWKDTMPDGWNWKTDNPFARYIAAGIDPNVYSDSSNVRSPY